MISTREERRQKRHLRVRKKISGTKDMPRIVVFKSSKGLYASLVNDEESPNRVLTTVSTLSPEIRKEKKEGVKGYNIEGAKRVGELLAGRAIKMGISKVVFDRSGYKYTGRLKSFADAARKGGLKF